MLFRKPYISPDFAFDLFQSLRFKASVLPSSWEEAIESLTQRTMEVSGRYPNYDVRDGDFYFGVTIYCADYFTCQCLDPDEICKHIAAVALTQFLPLARAHVRRWRIEGFTQPLVSLHERLSQASCRPSKGWLASVRAFKRLLHRKVWTKRLRSV